MKTSEINTIMIVHNDNDFVRIWDWIGKVLMHIFLPFLGTDKIKKIHQKYNAHHIKYTKYLPNYEEAIIDWECARFTKKDKPLTARQTFERLDYLTDYQKTKVEKQLIKFNL